MDNAHFFDMAADMTERTADFIIRNFKNPDRAAVVSGGKRPSLFIRKRMFEKIGKPFFPPAFFSTDEFTDYIASKENLSSEISEIDACFAVYEILKGIEGQTFFPSGDFPGFIPWAREIISFIEQSWLEDIDEKTAANAEHLGKIGYRVPEKINILLGRISCIRKMLRERLESRGQTTRGLTYLKASGLIKSMDLEEFESVIFCGLYAPCRTELEIIKTLYERKKAVLFFQGCPGEWSSLRATLKALGIPPPARPLLSPLPPPKLFRAFDIHSEAAAAGKVLKELEDIDNTVIVLPEPSSMVPLSHEISRHCGECNVSIGYPVRRSMFFSLISLIIKARTTSVNGGFYSEDYLGVIGHPFAKQFPAGADNPAAAIIIRKIEESLKGIVESPHSGRLFIKPGEVEESDEIISAAEKTLCEESAPLPAREIKEFIKAIHEIFFRNWSAAAGIPSFAAALEETVLFASKHPGSAGNPIEEAAAEELLNLNDELRFSAAAGLRLTFGDTAAIFLDLAGTRRITLPGTPLKGLQILGFLETRLLKFKNVAVMDLNEGVLPALKPAEPLIPAEILNLFRIKNISREEETQRYHFRRLLAGAENVMLFYIKNDRMERSRFIEEIIWEEEKKSRTLDPFPEKTAVFMMNASRAPEPASMEKTDTALFLLRGLLFSATSLNTYVNCPLRFYFRYIQGLRETEDMLREPEGADVGRFVHELLEKTFTRFLGAKPVLDAEFRDFFHSYFKKFFKNYFGKRLGAGAFMLERVMEHRLERFLRAEENRSVGKILSLEDKLSGEIQSGSVKAGLIAVIDRTEETPESDLLVIDYKTGAGDKLPSKYALEAPPMSDRREIKKRFSSLQLPLYMLLAGGRHPGRRINSCLYSLRNAKLDMLFKEAAPAAGGAIDNFAGTIKNVISEIMDPDIPFEADPSGVSCKFCPYAALCGNHA